MRRLALLICLFASGVTADPGPVRLVLGGDVMFGRMTNAGYVRHDAVELGAWRTMVANADAGLVNLETGICEQGRTASRFPLLWAPPARLDELGGRVVANLANNHALDCGATGLTDTIRHLEARGLAHVGRRGDGPLVVSEHLVVVAATMHPPPYRAANAYVQSYERSGERLRREVRAAHLKYPQHAIVVSLHWGKERSSKVAAWQQALAAALVDAGATVIAGHGSHTSQVVERRGDALVFYSLGNLAFDDGSPVGRPVPAQVVALARTDDGWRATVEDPVAAD